MTTTDSTGTDHGSGAGGCPVMSYSPHELKPIGEWTAFFDAMREQGPVIRNTFGDGYYVFTHHEDILEAYQDHETFSTLAVTVMEPNPSYRWIPHMVQGDEHFQWRRNLGAFFSPRTVAKYEDHMRERAGEIIDAVLESGSCDVMADFGFKFPTSIFLELMGLPVDDLDQFMLWESDILHSLGRDPQEVAERRAAGMKAVTEYFRSVIADRRVSPQDDLVSHAIGFEIDGRPVTDTELESYCLFMFMAGLDTVAAAIGYMFHHLATTPSDRQRIVDDPSRIPAAIEEILRANSFTIPARKVTKDIEVAGCPIKAGSMVQLPLKLSTRDESVFEDAKTVDIDRHPNNHIAFGAGPHRCLGSHLARLELKVALEEWHRRIPQYRLADDSRTMEVGRSSGPDSIKLAWDVSDVVRAQA